MMNRSENNVENTKIHNLNYIAGCVDYYESISISVCGANENGKTPTIKFIINFKQLKCCEHVLEGIKKTLEYDKIHKYVQNILMWQTSKVKDTQKICAMFLPLGRMRPI